MKPLFGFGAAAALLLSPTLVQAQSIPNDGGNFDRGRNVSVLERPHPEYDALGIHTGSFLFYPRLDSTLTYDDNIYALTTGKVADTFVTLTPRATFVSDWSIHQLTVSAYAARSQYLDRSDESHTDYGANADGRLDIERGAALTASAAYDRGSEPRSSIETIAFVREPVRYDTGKVQFGGGKTFNRVRIGGSYGLTDYNYKDAVTTSGVVLSQKYRNRKEDAGTVRLDYAYSPDTSFYMTAARNTVSYDLTSGGAVNRDSKGYYIDLGTDFDLTALISGHVQVGYLTQNFENKALFSSLKGFSASANIDYFPTAISTIRLHAARSFQSTGLATSAGYTSTTAGVELDHELYRNIILTGKFDYEVDEFRGIDRNDNRYTTALGVTYLLNRVVGVTGSYSYFTQNSTGAIKGVDFDINRFELKLTAKY